MIMMALLHMAGVIEFRMHMKNPAPTGSGCIRFNDWKVDDSSEGGPVGIFKCGSQKEKYLGSVTI